MDAEERALQLARDLGSVEERDERIGQVELIAQLGGLTRLTSVVEFSELTDVEQQLARLVGEHATCNFLGDGVPRGWATFRRWAGLDPAGPLESRVETGGASAPRWKALLASPAGQSIAAAAEHALAGLEPLDRLIALLQIAAGEYRICERFQDAVAPEAVAAALEAGGPEATRWLKAFIADSAAGTLGARDDLDLGLLPMPDRAPLFEALLPHAPRSGSSRGS